MYRCHECSRVLPTEAAITEDTYVFHEICHNKYIAFRDNPKTLALWKAIKERVTYLDQIDPKDLMNSHNKLTKIYDAIGLSDEFLKNNS